MIKERSRLRLYSLSYTQDFCIRLECTRDNYFQLIKAALRTKVCVFLYCTKMLLPTCKLSLCCKHLCRKACSLNNDFLVGFDSNHRRIISTINVGFTEVVS